MITLAIIGGILLLVSGKKQSKPGPAIQPALDSTQTTVLAPTGVATPSMVMDIASIKHTDPSPTLQRDIATEIQDKINSVIASRLPQESTEVIDEPLPHDVIKPSVPPTLTTSASSYWPPPLPEAITNLQFHPDIIGRMLAAANPPQPITYESIQEAINKAIGK